MRIEVGFETILFVMFGVFDEQYVANQVEHALEYELFLFGPVLPLLVDDLVDARDENSHEGLVGKRLFHRLESVVDLDENVIVDLVLGQLELERVERRLGQVDEQTQRQIEQLALFARL